MDEDPWLGNERCRENWLQQMLFDQRSNDVMLPGATLMFLDLYHGTLLRLQDLRHCLLRPVELLPFSL